MAKIIATILLCLLSSCLSPEKTAKEDTYYHEKDYQQAWCKKAKGIQEYRLDDGTRVDCLTDQYAIEVDFASKWAESIGQAYYYARKTDRLPGVVLLLKTAKDQRYLDRIHTAAPDLQVWIMTPADLEH